MRGRLALLVATTAGIVVFGAALAGAASEYLYLLGDSEPRAAMSPTPPQKTKLPDYDGDGGPGLTLEISDHGAWESDPAKYQQWEYDLSGSEATITNFVVWAAPRDFDSAKSLRFGVHLLVCGSDCEVIGDSYRQISGVSGWTHVNLSLGSVKRAFAENETLVAKVTVAGNSSDDMWFAYGTVDFPAGLRMSQVGPTTTTTTVTTTTTTTTNAPATTTTVTPTTTTTEVETTTTTTTNAPATTTTVTPTTTTTEVETTTTTTGSESALVTGSGFDDGTPGPESPRVILMSDTRQLSTEPIETQSGVDLSPQEGLMVVFATAVESIGLYWEVAIALGGLMSILLLIGFSRNTSDRLKPGVSSRFAEKRLHRMR